MLLDLFHPVVMMFTEEYNYLLIQCFGSLNKPKLCFQDLKNPNKPQTKETKDFEKFPVLLELSIWLTIQLTGNWKFFLSSVASHSSLKLHHDLRSQLESKI